MAITDWPAAERPREKLLERGAAALSDAELLAIFLRVGVRGKSAVDLARDLLKHFESLGRLFGAGQQEFNAFPGMGQAKFSQLQAVMEMARRALAEDMSEGDLFDTPDKVKHWLQLQLGRLEHEEFVVVLLDAQNRLIAVESLFRGSLTQTSVYPREVVKIALRYNAASLMLAHNHPSGCLEPSPSDRTLTRTLRDALALVDVRVLDHFIVGRCGVESFAERGWM